MSIREAFTRVRLRVIPTALFVLGCWNTPADLSAQQQPDIVITTVQGTINPASASYIVSELSRAERMGCRAFVLELNTPGGLLQSTRDIVSALLESRVPVIVHVAPSGAQAASAGAFIVMAAHIAAMAPGTNIGAAHPVMQGDGQRSDSLDISMTKATNDAAAFARAIAERRGRNVRWAEAAVRASVSITEREALRDTVIDLITPSLDSLLLLIDGRTVITAAGVRTLETADAKVERRPMSWRERLLNILSDPNIAYIFMMLGIYGLFFELYNPGSIFPGVVGGICLILAFYSFNTLPVNYAGVALIGFGLILFVLEIKIVSHGLLSIGGTVAVLLGSLMLFDNPGSIDMVEVSLSVILAITACTAAFFVFVIAKGIAIQRREPVTGVEGLLGERGVVIDPLLPSGRILVHGEYWNARSESIQLPAGTSVIVKGMEQMTLIVEPSEGSNSSLPTSPLP